MKYYDNGKPIRESTGTEDKNEAKRRLKEKEGQVAQGLHQGPQVARTKVTTSQFVGSITSPRT
jgi:hypothetical protein